VPDIRRHVLVEGRVQGVCFRMDTCREAGRLKLTGWVRNLPDGRVEAVFEGAPAAVDEMVAWCHHGPPSAVVRHVAVRPEPWRGEWNEFAIR
jgi:acylphosphatase